MHLFLKWMCRFPNFIEHLLYTKSNTMFWKSGVGEGLPGRRQVLELEQEMPSQAVCLNTGSPADGALMRRYRTLGTEGLAGGSRSPRSGLQRLPTSLFLVL